MNVKQTVKKMSAVMTGAAMLGATVMGAMAMDLSDYPAPFVADGAFQGKLVIGSGGTAQGIASDMLGAIDIAAGLQAASVRPVSVSGAAVTIEGAYNNEFELNDAFPGAANAPLVLDQGDLAGFQDRTIRWDGRNIRIVEELRVAQDAMSFETSSINRNEDFGGDVYLTAQEDSVRYGITFRDVVDLGRLNTERGALEFQFLGMDMRVIGNNSATGDLVVEASREIFMTAGETITVDGYDVRLDRVADGSVQVTVNGQTQIISSGGLRTFSAADFFEVEVESVFYIEAGHAENGAVLKLGEEITTVISHDQPADLLGESDRRNEAEWFWVVEATGGNLSYVGIENKMQRVEVDAPRATERPAIGVGESWSLPNNYVHINFDGFFDTRRNEVHLNAGSRTSFIYDDDGEDEATPNRYVLEWTTDASTDVFYIGSDRADQVFLYGLEDVDESNSSGAVNLWLAYEDGDDLRLFEPREDFEIAMTRQQRGDIVVDAFKDDDDFFLRYTFSSGEVFHIFLGTLDAEGTFDLQELSGDEVAELTSGDRAIGNFRRLGNERNDGDAEDFEYASTSPSEQYFFGNQDFDLMTTYGVLVRDPETQADRDRFHISIPYEQAEARFSVTTTRSAAGTGPATGGAVEINPIGGTGIAVTDTNAQGLLGTTPLIVVGGPAVNTIARTLLGNPSAEEVAEMFEPGLAKIRLFADRNALLVAGYSAEDTLGASYVLADYASYAGELVGTEVEVVVTDATNVALRSPTGN